jgi:hypothetical protein
MLTRIVWWFLQADECNFHTQTVMLTRMSVIMNSNVLKPHYACRNHSCVWCLHAYCVSTEHTHECNFWTQSVVSTRTSVILIFRVWFLHAENNFHTQCDVEKHNCEYDTYDRYFNTHKSDFYTQKVMLTRMSVNMTLTKVIMTLIRVKTTLWV